MARNAREIWQEHRAILVVVALICAFITAFFWRRMFIKIGPGEAGVLYRLFQGGTQTQTTYSEGLHVIFPWNTMYVYNLRLQQVPDEFMVLSQDGLAVTIEVSIRFNPVLEKLGQLHKEIGPDYINKIVKPEIQSQCRFVIGQYKPEEIYTSQGFIFQTVAQGALGQLAARYISLDGLLIKSVALPKPVAAAIESKLRAQQLAEEFDYRLTTEAKEAERKRIEAAGIRDFQSAVAEEGDGFEQFLRFKGIEASLALAQSPNSKVVVVGGGKDQLPLLFNGTSPAPAPASPPSPLRTR